MVTEFAAAKKTLGATGAPTALKAKGFGELTQVGEFALVSALKEYSENPETKSLYEGAKEGAIIAMTIPIAQKGLGLLKNFGKATAERFVHFTTGSFKVAKDFVRNPSKYNLNPFGNPKTHGEIVEANKAVRLRIQNQHKSKMDAFNARLRHEKELLNIKLKDGALNTRRTLDEAKQSLKEKSETTLDTVSKSVSDTIEKNNRSLSEGLVKTYDDALAKFQIIRDSAGKSVNAAITSTLERNPNAGIPNKIIKNKWNTVLKKHSPFKITKKGASSRVDIGSQKMNPQLRAAIEGAGGSGEKATARTAAASQSDATTFNRILEEFNSRSSQKDMPLMYLQNLKKDVKVLSQRAYSSGNSELGRFYSELSKSVDPAKAVAENPSLAKGLKEIAAANKAYNDVVPKYEEALRLYFKKNSQGGYSPDISKAVTAVRGGNKAVLTEMKKADSALPEADRILPKVREMVKVSNSMEQQHKSMIKVVKAKAKQEQFKLNQAAKKTTANLRKEHGKIRYDQKEKALGQVKEYTANKNTEYEATINELNKAEEFYKNQETMRSLRAGGSGPARLIQNIAGFGTATAIGFGDVPKALGSAGVVLGLSPVVSGGLVKATAEATGPAYRVLQALLESEPTRRVIAGKIINSDKKGK